MPDEGPVERLFSYGTLRLAAVQVALFGRTLDGVADALPGYVAETVAIDDAGVVSTSGSAEHPILRRTNDPAARVEGMVFALTPAELAHADAYEVAVYARVAVTLASGTTAWAYVDAAEVPGG